MHQDSEEATAIYAELRRLAARLLRRERDTDLLQTADLVNEAYLRLHGQQESWADRAHFVAAAARAMRRVLIDRARRRRAQKRRHDLSLIDLDEAAIQVSPDLDDYLAIDRALRRLDGTDPELAQLIELRFFGGLSLEETAQALGVSARTVKRRWRDARDRLSRELFKP